MLAAIPPTASRPWTQMAAIPGSNDRPAEVPSPRTPAGRCAARRTSDRDHRRSPRIVADAAGEVVVEVDRVVDAGRPQGVALHVQRTGSRSVVRNGRARGRPRRAADGGRTAAPVGGRNGRACPPRAAIGGGPPVAGEPSPSRAPKHAAVTVDRRARQRPALGVELGKVGDDGRVLTRPSW